MAVEKSRRGRGASSSGASGSRTAPDRTVEQPALAQAGSGTPARLWFALVCGVFVSIGAVYFVVTHRALSPESFELVEANPSSLGVESSQKQPFVEFHLANDPLRYRIPVERFRDFADPNGFLRAASRKGAVLKFHIERGARQNPERPRIDPKPTVFVESMRVDGTDYYPLAKRIEWDRRNTLYAKIIAVIFPLLTIYLGRLLWKAHGGRAASG